MKDSERINVPSPRPLSKKEVKKLQMIMDEHFQAYIVVGFDITGQKQCFSNTKNNLKDYALLKLLEHVLEEANQLQINEETDLGDEDDGDNWKRKNIIQR